MGGREARAAGSGGGRLTQAFARLLAAFDAYILALLATVALASLLPAEGQNGQRAEAAANAAIMLLFFLHGAKLSRASLIAGASNWRLQGAVLGATFGLFPLLGEGIAAWPGLPPPVASGMLFLTLLPSTVQSSVAFTAIARGNVAGAVCAASASNLLGLVITPFLAMLMMRAQGIGVGLDAVGKIVEQLFLPFLAGQLLRPRIGGWVAAHRRLVGMVDRGSILLVVYAAFSAAVAGGIWRCLPPAQLLLVGVLAAVLLATVLGLTWALGRVLGLARADAIVLLFCGSKKSLASGVPLAGVLFAPAQVGLVVVPLMLFHQLQLMACAVIARTLAASSPREA